MKRYPLKPPADDPRFTFGLMHDVAKLIEARGYPKLEPDDLVDLQQALFRFIYTPRSTS